MPKKKHPDNWPWYLHQQSGTELPLPFKPTPLEFFWVTCNCSADTQQATTMAQTFSTHTIIKQRRKPYSYRIYYLARTGEAILHYAIIRDKSPLQPWREMSYELQVVEI